MALIALGVYVGSEFPAYYGKEIEIQDCQDNSFPCYKIRFIGENEWIDNMDDDDVEFYTQYIDITSNQ